MLDLSKRRKVIAGQSQHRIDSGPECYFSHHQRCHCMKKQPTLQIIGTVHCDISSREEAPKNYSESDRVGTLDIYPQYGEVVEGIVLGQTFVFSSSYPVQRNTIRSDINENRNPDLGQ